MAEGSHVGTETADRDFVASGGQVSGVMTRSYAIRVSKSPWRAPRRNATISSRV
jgi:hypothetical protein